MQLNKTCKHPPRRLYCWWAWNVVTGLKDWFCIACCDCGTILKGSQKEYERYLKESHAILKGKDEKRRN